VKAPAADRIIKILSLILCLTAMFVVANAQAADKADKDQAPKELTEAQKEKKAKNQAKNQARCTEKEFMNQLVEGEPSAAQLAEYLKVDASRIGATVDPPSSLGLAVIRKLKQMPPEKRTKEVLPALEKQLMQMLREDVEPPQMVSLTSDSPANQILISGRFLNIINALAAIGLLENQTQSVADAVAGVYGLPLVVDVKADAKPAHGTPGAVSAFLDLDLTNRLDALELDF